MKSILIFLIVSVGLAAMFVGRDSNTARSKGFTAPTVVTSFQTQQQNTIIDGATHPELIPDRTAYSVLFRLIANRRTPEERSRIRAYIRQIGFTDVDVDALIALANEFHERVSPLDAEAKQIKSGNRGIATPELRTQLLQLQRQKEAIVDHLVVSLPDRLSPDGVNQLRQHVTGRVKRRLKYQLN